MNINKRLAEHFGLCWHEWKFINGEIGFPDECTCGHKANDIYGAIAHIDNPSFTSSITLLRRHSEEKGEWERFKGWFSKKNFSIVKYGVDKYDTLTNPQLLSEAYVAFVEEKGK